MNNYNIKISIITVCYNSALTLEQTILSVINQTYKNIEYIIIDGGSTDNTVEIIKRYDNRIAKWISEPDKGISDAFNKGLNMATGDIIGIINSDDWYEKDCFNDIIAHYYEADILHGLVRYWKDNNIDYIFQGNHNYLTKEMTINHMSSFVKKHVYFKEGFFNREYKYAMDYDLMLRFYKSGNNFYYIPKILSNMRLNGASDKNWIKAYYESKKIKDNMLGNRSINYLYFYWQIIRTITRKTFTNLKLEFIVILIRKHASILPKSDNKR